MNSKLSKEEFIEKYSDDKYEYGLQTPCRVLEYAKIEDCFRAAERRKDQTFILIYEGDDVVDSFHVHGNLS
ncbi:MAG: hypothetical protein SPI59_06240 [Finegoldia sp.]|nr:hypothetical protein [Finegoldia sp.]